MPAGLRDLLDARVETILREDVGLLGEDNWRESGPPGNSNCNFGALRDRGRGHKYHGERRRNDPDRCHDSAPSEKIAQLMPARRYRQVKCIREISFGTSRTGFSETPKFFPL